MPARPTVLRQVRTSRELPTGTTERRPGSPPCVHYPVGTGILTALGGRGAPSGRPLSRDDVHASGITEGDRTLAAGRSRDTAAPYRKPRRDLLAELETIGACVWIVAIVWGGLWLMRGMP